MDLAATIIPKSDQMERWLPVPGYEGSYEVSSLGRIRSLDRITSHGRRVKGTVLKPLIRAGYPSVGLHRGGETRIHLVHRLVLTAFAGLPSDGVEARHLDGDPLNNTLSNLAWGTSSENKQDQLRHGTHRNARKKSCPNGHPYAGENLKVEKSGTRRCATCRRESFRRVNARRSVMRKAA